MASTDRCQTAKGKYCWECQRRDAICDGSMPFCMMCKSTGIVCPGYKNEKPLKWLPPGNVTKFRRKRASTPTKHKVKELASSRGDGKGDRRSQRTLAINIMEPDHTVEDVEESKASRPISKLVARPTRCCEFDFADTASSDDVSSIEVSGSGSGIDDSSCNSTLPPDSSLILIRKLSNHHNHYIHQQNGLNSEPIDMRRWSDSTVSEASYVLSPTDLKPKEWDFTEALSFYERIFDDYLPNALTPGILSLPMSAQTLSRMDHSLRDSFVASAIALRLSAICWKLGNYDPNPSGPVGRLWETYLHYIGRSIHTLNQRLACISRENIDKVFCGINGLLNAELSLSRSTHWRVHVAGFLSFMRMCGGLHALVDGSLEATVPLLTFVVKCTLANTTSPYTDQISEVSSFNDDDLRKLYSVCTYPTFPYPTDLFLSIVRINRLRLQMGSDPSFNVPESSISSILHDIETFNTKEWVQSWDLADSSRLAIGSHIFQSTVAIYCLFSLQPHLHLNNKNSSTAAAAAAPRSSNDHTAILTLHLDRILLNLRKGVDCIPFREVLIWPLLVAGVAAQNLQQRALVSTLLSGIVEEAVFLRWAAEGLGILTRGWAAGATEWDEFFDRPYFIV